MSDIVPIESVLANPPAVAALPLLVRAKQLAVLLGVSVRTIHTWDAAGRLPAPIRIGGSVSWRRDEIDDWLHAGCPSRAEWSARSGKWKK
jgi:excisionase family DNA binding protein